LRPERIEPETSRRSILPDPKPIPPGQPKWVYHTNDIDTTFSSKFFRHIYMTHLTYNLFNIYFTIDCRTLTLTSLPQKK
jgi:hypothetical protein